LHPRSTPVPMRYPITSSRNNDHVAQQALGCPITPRNRWHVVRFCFARWLYIIASTAPCTSTHRHAPARPCTHLDGTTRALSLFSFIAPRVGYIYFVTSGEKWLGAGPCAAPACNIGFLRAAPVSPTMLSDGWHHGTSAASGTEAGSKRIIRREMQRHHHACSLSSCGAHAADATTSRRKRAVGIAKKKKKKSYGVRSFETSCNVTPVRPGRRREGGGEGASAHNPAIRPTPAGLREGVCGFMHNGLRERKEK
jgi:hypothetical protein